MTVDVHSLRDLPNIYNQQYTKEVADSIERIDTGLKINSTSDDSAAAIISTSLRANVSSLVQGVENVNNGYALVEVSNKALDFQEDILNKIKQRLELAKTENTSTLDSLKENINTLIDEFDTIASSTSYNDRYTLQQSNDDNSASASSTITLTATTNITTPSIRSNSEGVNLSELKNLQTDQLSLDVISEQLTNINTAIETLNEFKNDFALTKEELGIASRNLTTNEEGNKAAEQELIKADLVKEEGIFNKYKLLVDTSKYSIAQANLSQERVLDLLTNIPEYAPVVDNNTIDDTNETTDFAQKEENKFEFTSSTSSASQSSTNTAPVSSTGSSSSTSSSSDNG